MIENHRNDALTSVLAAWSEVLEISQSDGRVNFFEAGGDSLSAAQAVGLLAKLGYATSLADLFEHPIAEEFAAELSRVAEPGVGAGGPEGGELSQPVAELTGSPPSFSQLERLELEEESARSGLPVPRDVMIRVYRVGQPLDFGLLRRSVKTVLQRHPVLRTFFRKVDGDWKRLLHGSEIIPVQRSFAAAHRLDAAIAATLRHEFDLCAAPLFRVTYIETDDGHGAIVFLLHHILADAWSLGLVMRDVSAGYRTHTPESHARATKGPVFDDVVAAEESSLTPGVLAERLSYWRTVLGEAGPRPGVSLRGLPPRPPRQTYLARSEVVEISAARSARLGHAARDLQTTPTMLMAAALQLVLLHRGLPGSLPPRLFITYLNREKEEWSDVVGPLFDALPFAPDLSSATSRAKVARAVTRSWSATLAHKVPYALLARELQPDSHAAVPMRPFVILNMLEGVPPEPDLELPGVDTARVPLSHDIAFPGLTFTTERAEGGGRTLGLRYEADWLEPSHARELLQEWLDWTGWLSGESSKPVQAGDG
ncbi:condensation domain-containing protein [Streptomyces sp. NPDC059989]|uniref:condensation domain-containing protein n=1 Tax=Streptomyces sp. NPDC059989 TaxID=3347026 RepID=UPI0036A3E1ED